MRGEKGIQDRMVVRLKELLTGHMMPASEERDKLAAVLGRSYGWTFEVQNVSIVDVGTSDAFYQGHIPFALNIPGTVFKSNISNTNKLSEILGSAGVNVSHETVLISGAGLTRDAALTFVLLEKLGQKLQNPKGFVCFGTRVGRVRQNSL